MGLLDEAIREHLDLKRRRGADPAEIERAEREALGPVRRPPEPGAADHAAAPVVSSLDGEETSQVAEPAPGSIPQLDEISSPAATSEPEAISPSDATSPSERTSGPSIEEHAEQSGAGLDHRSELGQEPPFDSLEADHAPYAAPTPNVEETLDREEPAPPETIGPETVEYDVEQEHALERERAAQRERALEEERAREERARDEQRGQEGHGPGEEGHRQEQGEPSGDQMLEETPEFLQDTPDHDRLWFEQRPPRDFDFEG